MSHSAVFVALAAGSARRFDASGDPVTERAAAGSKVFADLADKPVLAYSLEAAAATPGVGRLVVVAHAGAVERAESVLSVVAGDIPALVVTGGDSRQQSELAGLEAIADDIANGRCDLVAIHDAARPFVTAPLLTSILDAAEGGGAVPGLPPTDAIWDAAMIARAPLEKMAHRSVQTPQAFLAAPLLDAYRAAAADRFDGADTASTVRRYTDLHMTLISGDRRNIKLTFPEDLAHAVALASSWTPNGWLD